MADDVENAYSLGRWVRRRRRALDLTQAALAERVACAEVTIRKIESNRVRPSRTIAERLATCLDMSPDERAVFLQVAGGERSAVRLPARLTGLDSSPPAPTQEPGIVLPLDMIPAPAPLPTGSRMRLSRNPVFVGRDTNLRQLAGVFHGGGTAAIGHLGTAAATGLGGIGKTQLACEFVHRYGQFFAGGVFWLSFADPAAVPAEVAACGGADAMHLRPEFGTLPLDEQVKLVLAAWASPLPRLLVFDNCEEETLLEQWRPKYGGCRVLMTSRRHHWDAPLGVQPLPLAVLARSESLTLLRSFRPDLPADDANLHAIAATLGDLPLALHLAGSFLAKYRHAITSAQYLARLHAPAILDDRSLQAAGLSPTQHVQHVARTFEQSYERLDPADPVDALARMLLAHAASFAPGEPLPRWLLLQTLDLPEEDAERALVAEDALTRLIDLGLLDTDAAGVLRLHRLLVAFVQVVLVDGADQAAVESTMIRVVDDLNERRNPRPLLAIQPHLRCITEAAHPRADARTAGLCNALGYHLWQLGLYPEAQSYLEQAVAIRERVLGVDHPDTARSLSNLGVVLWTQGQYAQAQRSYEQALAIRERVLGVDHPQTVRSLSNLGDVLYQQGQYTQAQRSYEQAAVILERVLGADHPDTARILNNLGLVLKDQGQYAQAQRSYEQVLAIWQRVLGADHPDTARGLMNLGLVLKDQGQYAQAQRSYEQAIAILERVLGAGHPDTARGRMNLGVVLKDQGQYAQAQHYLEQALTMYQRVLGADHPDTAVSLRGLGELLHARGDVVQARHYLEQAFVIFEQRLGPQHPDTEQTRRMLATFDTSPE